MPEEVPSDSSDMAFRFFDLRKVLHGLSMELQPGKTTALVGASGSGKSTSVKLGCALTWAD